MDLFCKNNAIVSLTEKTRYYPVVQHYTSSTNFVLNNSLPTTIKAICAYL